MIKKKTLFTIYQLIFIFYIFLVFFQHQAAD